MRTAPLAKLALTASVGFGTLFGLAGTAAAETPPHQGGMVLTTPTTTPDPHPGPIQGEIVLPADPDPDPDPPFEPELPLSDAPEDDDCPQPQCDLAPAPQDDDDPEPDPCGEIALCDEITTEPDCTHGCDEDPDPECHPLQASCDLTSNPDEPGEDPGDEDGCDDDLVADLCPQPGDEPDEPGDEPGDGGRGGLPRTGGTILGLVAAGSGLTGLGAALRRVARRDR